MLKKDIGKGEHRNPKGKRGIISGGMTGKSGPRKKAPVRVPEGPRPGGKRSTNAKKRVKKIPQEEPRGRFQERAAPAVSIVEGEETPEESCG